MGLERHRGEVLGTGQGVGVPSWRSHYPGVLTTMPLVCSAGHTCEPPQRRCSRDTARVGAANVTQPRPTRRSGARSRTSGVSEPTATP
jgi:hypothetical protein